MYNGIWGDPERLNRMLLQTQRNALKTAVFEEMGK
jgi:hypothetical protein